MFDQVFSLMRMLQQSGMQPEDLQAQFKTIGAAADAMAKVKKATEPTKEEKEAQMVPPSLQPPQQGQMPSMPSMMPQPTPQQNMGYPASLAQLAARLRGGM